MRIEKDNLAGSRSSGQVKFLSEVLYIMKNRLHCTWQQLLYFKQNICFLIILESSSKVPILKQRYGRAAKSPEEAKRMIRGLEHLS